MPKRSFDDPLYNGTPYSLDDVDEIEAVRGKPYPRLRKTVELLNRLKANLEDRDGKRADMFIAAALSGTLARGYAGTDEDIADVAIGLGSLVASRYADNEELENIDDPQED